MDIKAVYKRNIGNYINLYVVIRIIIATALLLLANSLHVENFISVMIMTLALIVAGYDVIISAGFEIKARNFFSYKCIVALVLLVGFCMGCFKEAVTLAILYQLGFAMLNYVVKRSRGTATDYVPEENTKDIAMLRSIINRPEVSTSSLLRTVEPYLDIFTKAMLAIGLLYAVFMPLISNLNYHMSVRRGLMLMLTALPFSVITSLPICAITGIACSAAYGVFIKNPDVLYKSSDVDTIIFDKSDVFCDGVPTLVSITSPIYDNKTFIRLSAYVAYYSDQRIAAPIVSAYKGCVNPEIIEDFTDIPGCGMEVVIDGIKIYLGTAELLAARGVELPEGEEQDNFVLYMVISDKCAGRLDFTENLSPYAESVVEDFRNIANINSVLFTEDSRASSEKLADELGISRVYSECDSMKKMNAIEEILDELDANKKLMYVSAENLDFHTAADIDAKVGYASENADMLMSNVGVFGLPVAFTNAQRTKAISMENVIFSIIVKIVLIILAFTGSATMWFVAFIELAAACATVLNASRIPDESLIDKFRRKFN